MGWIGINHKQINNMNRIFTIVAIATMALFVACEKPIEGSENDANFKLTAKNTYDVGAEGETIAVTYTIANPVAGTDVTTTIISGNEAIKAITKPAVGVVLVEVKANTTTQKRLAVINISYATEAYDIVINQAAGSNTGNNNGNNGNNDEFDVEVRALYLNGYYYGEKYGEGADRYAFFLSRKGMNNGGQAHPEDSYYYIDAFAPANKSTSLPLGTYLFDKTNSGAPYTINSENSQLFVTGTTVEESTTSHLTDAKMVVAANQITLYVTIDGKRHKVNYIGELAVEDASGENGDNGGGGNDDVTGGQDKEAKTTLTGDYNVTFDGEHRAKWGYEGDYWQVGYSNYTIFIMNKSNGYVIGDTLQLDVITDNQSKDGDFYGEYTCSYTPGKNVMMAGFTNNYAQSVGTWLFDYASASAYNGYAMIVDGTLKITDNGDGTSTIVLDAYDCLNNNITCNWTGVIEKD